MNKTWYIAIAVVVIVGAFLLFAPASAPNGGKACPEVIVWAKDPVTGEVKTFPTPCDVPEGWVSATQDDISPASPSVGVEVPSGIAVEPVTVYTVRVTANGFEPSSLTVKKGNSVTWLNESGREVWPASAVHPTHTAYPGSGVEKCGTAEAATIFDACGGIANGSSWSFVFNEAGTWKYHDHLRATVFGSITVQ